MTEQLFAVYFIGLVVFQYFILQITKNTPTSFLVHVVDDGTVPVDNSIRFYQACIKNRVPVEMHLYPEGGPGFSMNNKTTNDNRLMRLKNWKKKVVNF